MATPTLKMLSGGRLRLEVLDSDGEPLSFDPHDLDGASFTLTGDISPPPAPSVLSFEANEDATQVILDLDAPLVSWLSYRLACAMTLHTSEGPVISPSFDIPSAPTPKAAVLAALLPTVFKANQPTLRALLAALAYTDEQIGGGFKGAAMTAVKLVTTLLKADGFDLDRAAAGYGVQRLVSTSLDSKFRPLALVTAGTPKSRRKVFHDVLTVLLGPGFKIYEVVPGEVVVEVPAVGGDSSANPGGHRAASYLKADATVAENPVNNPGDYMMTDATVVGPDGRDLIAFSASALTEDAENMLNAVKAAGIKITVETKIL